MKNLTSIQIKNFSNQLSNDLLSLKIKTDYQKIILSKDKSGKATNFLLRKKIELNPKNPKFLQTIRGAGYVLWIK